MLNVLKLHTYVIFKKYAFFLITHNLFLHHIHIQKNISKNLDFTINVTE